MTPEELKAHDEHMYNILGFADAHWYPNVQINEKYHFVRVA